MASDCATIIKRGYLTDKKSGILDRKRWYVLRLEVGGSCILEYFKDEKSAARGDQSRGFINIHKVIEIQRVADKKQMFELLCPGLSYRLAAGSDMEANEWVEAIKKFSLPVYHHDDMRTLSLQHLGTVPPLSQGLTSHSTHSLSSAHPFAIPQRSPGHASNPPSFLNDYPLSHSPQTQTQTFLRSYPTPPESTVGVSTGISQQTPMFQKQGSNDGVNPYPSPPSSDSSSMCSGSNENSLVLGDTSDDMGLRSKFRVEVKGTDKLHVSGPCDLWITEDSIILCSTQTGQQLVSWPIESLRRYGVNNWCFTFDTGRYCSTGEGRFYFYSPHSRLIHSKVHYTAMRRNSSRELRRSSAPENIALSTRSLTSVSQQAINMPHPQSNNMPHPQSNNMPHPPTTTSPPQYNHIEHNLRPMMSHDSYSFISTTSTTTPITNYDKLSHTLIHSQTEPMFHHCNSADETASIYSNLQEMREERDSDDDGDSPIMFASDREKPPPVPPRPSPPIPPRPPKMTTI